MPPSETSDRTSSIDPARRYKAIEAAAIRTRANGESYDILEALVESVYSAESARFALPEPEPTDDVELEAARARELADLSDAHIAAVRRGVRSAIATYDVPMTRQLFDACLLAGADETDLAQAFSVDPLETVAYRHLFFDRNVFPNAFHLSHYIATRTDPGEETILRIALNQGFEAIVMQYGLGQPISPEAVLTNVLAADAAAHRRYRELPITSQATKEVRALTKQVVATAQAIHKVQESKTAAAERMKGRKHDEDFVLVPGPVNPTLDDLLAAGGVIAVPEGNKL